MKPPALLLGAGAGLLLVLALAPATGNALGTLARARAAHAQAAAEQAGPAHAPALVAPGLAFRAGDAAAARAALMARVQALAKAGGVLVEETGAIALPDGVAGLRIRVSGAEKAVLALADGLERARPVSRLRAWRVEPIAGGGVRLTGELIGAWQ